MSETNPDDSPQPKLRPVGDVATSNKATPGCGGPLVVASAIIRALSQRKKNNQDELLVNLNASGSTRTQSQQTKAQSQSSKESGSFGNVYKGKLPNGRVVAIKRRQALKKYKKTHTEKKHNQVGELTFEAEIEMIGKAKHRNLLCLLGFCETPTERILVYPFMVNGNVASWLKVRDGAQPLSWEIRKKIAVGAANGLAYLHDDCEPKIIHRNVKAANILLDKDFEAIVSGFELVKFLESEDTHVTTGVCGTRGYIAPEYFSTRRCSARADVYGYGHTLLEIISGKRPFELATTADNSDIRFTDWMGKMLKEKKLDTIVDPKLQGNYDEDEVERFIQVALLCIQYSAKTRPKMSEVITMLEGNDSKSIHTRWKDWQYLLAVKPKPEEWIFDSLGNSQAEELSGPR